MSSKKKNNFVRNLLVVAAIAAVMLLAYVILLQEVKEMNKEKVERQDLLHEKNNKIREKFVEIQKLSSEERIVEIAENKLKMVRAENNNDVLHVSETQILQIERIIDRKYE